MTAASQKPTVLVTGGSRGIGLAIAARFARDNFEVMIVGRERAPLESAAATLGPTVRFETGDVAIRADVERIAA